MRSIWMLSRSHQTESLLSRTGHARTQTAPVVGPDHLRQPKLLEGALEDGEGEFLLGRGQGRAV